MSFSKILLGGKFILVAIAAFPRVCSAAMFSKNRNIIDDTLFLFYRKNYSASEKQKIEAIEALRKNLTQSNAEIPRIEFGSGSNILSNTGNTEKIRDVARIMSKSRSECLFLYSLIKSLKPIRSIELGTCLGISAAYIGAALDKNGGGTLTTLEGSPERANVADENIKKLGLINSVKIVHGRFQDTLKGKLQELNEIDFAFIDGHHDGAATINYYNQFLPQFKNGGIMVFDDIFWSAGMHKAWETIKSSDKIIDSFVYRGMGGVLIMSYKPGLILNS